MSKKTVRLGLAGLVTALVLGGLVVAALAGGASAASRRRDLGATPRQIQLEARGMAFYRIGDLTNEPNPTLAVRAGEQLEISLRNADPGVSHDLVTTASDRPLIVPFSDATTRSVRWRAPSETGRYEYVCTLHERMMRGTLLVE
jgi:plastocyanin